MPARLLYTLLWLLALPLILLRLLRRARLQPGYREHLGERFGRYPRRIDGPLIWVHAVSVGETRAAEPLVHALLARWPDHSVLITHMTPTGRETSTALFAHEPRVRVAYLPYDLASLSGRFLDHFRPRFGVVMETELWPNLLYACRKRGIPVTLANARLSERSARRYARWPSLARPTFAALEAAGAQTEDDARRLIALGAQKVEVTGNIKFDVAPPDRLVALASEFRERFGDRQVVLAASTRDGEEALLLDAFAAQAPAGVLLALVPRHPQRFDEVAALVAARKLPLARRSAPTPVTPDTRVWLGDSMGEMFAYYAAADVALIGGSWLPFGGQNLIEACAVGTPVLLGPHTFNFAQVADQAIACGAARRAHVASEGVAAALALLHNKSERDALAEAGRRFAQAHRGATARTMTIIERHAP